MYVWRPHEDNETQGQVGQLSLLCHSGLRNEIGAWGFKGKECNPQDDKKNMFNN